MKKLLLLPKIILVFISIFLLLNPAKSQVTVSIPCNKDNTIYSSSPDLSNGMGDAILTGRQGADANYTIARSLLHFDLSSIPPGSIINSATLTLHISKAKGGDISLHKVKANWGEGASGVPGTGQPQWGYPAVQGDATWSYAFFPDTKWDTPGGDFEANASAIAIANYTAQTFVINNLRADVQSWINNPSINFGWILKGTDDSITYTAKLLYSRNSSDEHLRPVLQITYCVGSTFYTDEDGDGYGNAAKKYFAADCVLPAGYAYDSTDCNDENAAVHPGACDAVNSNGIDDNCDGIVDNGIDKPKLYGTTPFGGSNNLGVIFSFDRSSSTYVKLKDLDNTNGAQPYGSLVQGSNGKLYGTTFGGGNDGAGVIFSFDPYTSTYRKLKDFDYRNGAGPYGSLMQASDGKLYGMTSRGGSSDVGVIFSFDPSTSTYIKLKDFDYTNGAGPYGSLMQANNGKLYGMTSYGGQSDGVIFSFDPSSSTYKKLKDFDNIIGSGPYGGLIQATDGKLYGMTSRGGKDLYAGVIFSFDPSSLRYKTLKKFDYTNGSYPNGNLIQASNGKLYGMTYTGGSIGSGVIFSFDPSTFTLKNLQEFGGTNGSIPYGSLMQASDGKLYGMTSEGGSSNFGVIFSFDPSSSTYSKLKDYDGANGANPQFGSALIEVNGCIDENKPPTVSITNPTTGENYTAPATITLSADASDVDGKVKTVSFYNGNTLIFTEDYPPFTRKWLHVPVGNYSITARATDNDGNITISDVIKISVVPNKRPTVKITSPVNGATYTSPQVIIPLSADAHDPDGIIRTVSFYNGNTLIFTEDWPPFSRNWLHVPVGNYSITARATDNKGAVTISAAVNISVVPDIAPLVLITSPFNGATYTSPVTIQLTADAIDIDGTIKTVDFYNGSTLLFTEKFLPYSRTWFDVPEGDYSITAKATDNNGKSTTSPPVVISVGAASVPLARGSTSVFANQPLSLHLNPNPVTDVLNISAYGLQENKQSIISVLSVSGEVLKIIQSNYLNKNVRLDVSSLSAGVYFIKVINGSKILYKQFVKL